MTDQNRKTLRSFYCRDYIWELFDQMTHDLGCTMDYLINESMRNYARSRNYAPNENDWHAASAPIPTNAAPPSNLGNNGFGQQPAPAFGGTNPNPNPFAPMEQHRTFDRIAPVNPSQSPPPTGGVQFGGQAPSPMPPPPPTPGWQQPPASPSGGFGQQPQPGFGQQPQPGFGQQPQPGFGQQPQPGFGAQPAIYLIFNNQRYTIDKDRFVIGRGSQQTDLTIRDGNISRQHCAILFQNGSYYIKDLESTNGVEIRGNRIESKKIDEGDVFYLCDYELRFTYLP